MKYKDAIADWIYISEEDARELIEHVSPRWRLAIKFLYHYGMRVSELLSMTPENFNKTGEIILPRLKHGRTTRQIIVPEIKEELDVLLRSLQPGEHLFKITRYNIWRNMQDAGRRADIDLRCCHPHAMRHACGRRWARMGTIPEVAGMLGHKSWSSTLKYSTLNCDSDMSTKFLGQDLSGRKPIASVPEIPKRGGWVIRSGTS